MIKDTKIDKIKQYFRLRSNEAGQKLFNKKGVRTIEDKKEEDAFRLN